MTMQRITKPTPKRTRPVRNISTAVRGSDKGKGNGKSRANGHAQPAIAQGVKLGYQLVEEYLDAGRSAAASLRESPNELSDSERLAQRLVRYTSEFASVGLELLQALTKPPPQPPPSGSAGPFAVPHVSAPSPPPQPSAASTPVRWDFELDTRRPVRLSVELDAQAPLRALVAHDLRCSQPAARIRPVELAYDPATQRISARLHVPEDAPAGEYHATLVDPTDNLPRGRLSVRVGS